MDGTLGLLGRRFRLRPKEPCHGQQGHSRDDDSVSRHGFFSCSDVPMLRGAAASTIRVDADGIRALAKQWPHGRSKRYTAIGGWREESEGL
jgi:hypothetical protein